MEKRIGSERNVVEYRVRRNKNNAEGEGDEATREKEICEEGRQEREGEKEKERGEKKKGRRREEKKGSRREKKKGRRSEERTRRGDGER